MNIFNIIGPVMIGPSSSHTAGAARIGKVASIILGAPVKSARVFFSGSFASTYKGHGTDRAVAGGLMGFMPYDQRIRNSLSLAEKQGMEIGFGIMQLQEYHPNTMMLELKDKKDKTLRLIASSVGGGSILIKRINDYDVDFNAESNTLLVPHEDRPGVVAETAVILAKGSINIAGMKVFRSRRGGSAIMVIETDEDIPPEILKALEHVKYVVKPIYIESVGI